MFDVGRSSFKALMGIKELQDYRIKGVWIY